MAEDLSVFNDLRQSIVDKIINNCTTIDYAYFGEKSQFLGSPTAIVGVSPNEALYNSSKMDRMTFVFQIRLYIPLTQDSDEDEVETRMGQAYWEVLRLFSSRSALSGFADFVEPIPSSWAWVTIGSGICRVAEINVRCVVFLSHS